MKKLFTILLAAGTVTFASAQSSHSGNMGDGRESSRDVVLGQSNSNVYRGNSVDYTSSFSIRERDQQIQRINREFDQKIAAVKRDRHMRSNERSREIRILERQRDEQIRQVQQRYDNNRNWNQHDDLSNSRKW